MNAADDFDAIARRWKEIREQNNRAVAGRAETPGTTAPAPSTVTGSGGFITPDGKPYHP